MPRDDDPSRLLDSIPRARRAEVSAAIDQAAISLLPVGTVGWAMHGGYGLQVGLQRVTVPDSLVGTRRRERLRVFTDALRAGWGAELRETLIIHAGGDITDPPAWAWRCPLILRDALALAHISPAQLLSHLRSASLGKLNLSIPLPTDETGIGSHTKLVRVERPPIGDRLRVTIELGSGVTYRDGEGMSYLKARSEIVARNTNVPQTVASSLAGEPASSVTDHALLTRPEYKVISAWTVRGCTRVRLSMPEVSLARLPSELAAFVPEFDRSDLHNSPWT